MQFSGVIKETTKIALGAGWSLSLPLAAKFCINDDKTNFAFVPKIGAAWQGERIQLFTDLYRMVQFPNMDDLFWKGVGYQGNPDSLISFVHYYSLLFYVFFIGFSEIFL